MTSRINKCAWFSVCLQLPSWICWPLLMSLISTCWSDPGPRLCICSFFLSRVAPYMVSSNLIAFNATYVLRLSSWYLELELLLWTADLCDWLPTWFFPLHVQLGISHLIRSKLNCFIPPFLPQTSPSCSFPLFYWWQLYKLLRLKILGFLTFFFSHSISRL